jgi:hypothetical protein
MGKLSTPFDKRVGWDFSARDKADAGAAEDAAFYEPPNARLAALHAKVDEVLNAHSIDDAEAVKEPENTGATVLDIDAVAPSEDTVVLILSIPQINKLHKDFQKTIVKGAETAFQIGKALASIKETLNPGVPWKEFVAENFAFSVSASYGYIRIYEQFKNTPEAVGGKTVRALLGEKDPVEHNYNRIAEGGAKPNTVDWEAVSSIPVLSGADLKNYRVERTSGDGVYVYDLKERVAVRALSLGVFEARRDLEPQLDLMMADIQQAVERYYAALEKTEAAR